MVKVQWYPGHMEKARRQMIDRLKAVDMVIELRDARFPDASRNPMLLDLAKNKPRLIVLAKTDMADPVITEQWVRRLKENEETSCIAVDLMRDNKAGKKIIRECISVMKPRRDRQKARGINPRAIRAMAAGIPNVGKSTMINRIAGKTTVKAADKPGVTRSLTWIHADQELDLLDTPGVLWPKFDDERTGTLLAAYGSINDEILERNMLAMDVIRMIQTYYPGLLEQMFDAEGENPNGMLKKIAVKRHLLKEEGRPDTRRAADAFLYDLRKGKIGRLTLERPEDDEKDEDLSE